MTHAAATGEASCCLATLVPETSCHHAASASPAMKTTPTAIADVLLLEPRVHRDARGFFFESFNRRVFQACTGMTSDFVQDNHSHSRKGVLRGLHYQLRQPQGKVVRVVRGAVFDVVVDIRRDSATFGHWVGMELSARNRRQLWIPPGLAHGFLALSEMADILYKATAYHSPAHERCLAWDDPTVDIAWPLARLGIAAPLLSEKDRHGLRLDQV